MAEFALGLTKVAVEGTLIRVKSAIEEEAKLKVRVQNDLVFITGEFEMMQSFLTVANKERAKNEVVQTWVRQLRDLAFDVEDCVELVVSLDIKSNWSWLWRVLPRCMAPPRTLDLAVAEIQRLKERVEDVSLRNTRYNLIGDSGSGSNSNSKGAVTVDSDCPVPNFLPNTVGPSSSSSSSGFRILSEVWDAAGKKKHSLGDLRKLICGKGSDLEVISLWGSTEAAHHGEAHIIRKAYCDPDICQEFKSRAWVKLIHPFNSDQFLESLLSQLYASSRQAKSNQDGDDDLWRTGEDRPGSLIRAEAMQQVKEHRYLVILEGVSTVAEWGAIKMYLRDSKKGSRVIVSTEQLGVALVCTGQPYTVSELSRFSDDQSLCAFLNKGFAHRLYVGELIWQISCRGVISVCGGQSILHQVFDCITLKRKELDGLEFQRHSWVDVDRFNLIDFSRRLIVNFYYDDFHAEEMAAVGIAGVIERCCRFLREDDCLVVINGLESTDDWDLIKATFLSEPIKGCILVIAREASVARHCVDHDTKVFNIKDLEDDVTLRLMIKGCEYSGFVGSRRGCLLSFRRRADAANWLDKFVAQGYVPHTNRVTSHLHGGLEEIPGVISLWGNGSVDKSAAVILVYCGLISGSLRIGYLKFFSWVNVPHPFTLTEFCWRLLLDFHSDDYYKRKEVASVDMMRGEDPIEECCRFLREERCLIVIDDLRSTGHWDQIRDTCLSEPIKSHIIVITDQEIVATYCVDEKKKAFNVNDPEADAIHSFFRKKEIEGFYSTTEKRRKKVKRKERREDAREWTDNFAFVGRHNEWHDLIRNLRNPCVVCISGMAGIGKSALVRSIYYTEMLPPKLDGFNAYFGLHNGCFSGYSWVDVPHPFNLTEFCWRLLVDFYSDDLHGKEIRAVGMIERQDPVQECVQLLREHRCFIVFDGIRSRDEFDLIRAALLSEDIKSSIFIITNEASVADHVWLDYEVVNLKGLGAHDALSLFAKKFKHSGQLTHRETEVSKKIIDKCGGIPQVIHATGEYVAELEEDKATYVLENFSDNFGYILKWHPQFRILKGLLSWMRSYFDACSDSVKPCIFYLSVFPADCNIRQRRLLRRWVAEGYSRDTSAGISAEQTGKNLFSELVTLNIIQQNPNNEVMCQVNGFFREYIISQPMEDNRVFALEGHCSVNSQRAGQHLTIMSSWDRDKNVFESIDFTRLRSLTVFGEWSPFIIPTSDSNNMTLLRVLDLEDTSGLTNGDIKQIGNLLPRLKFLSLRGCIEITYLPSSLGVMRQLQTLDIKNTSIVSLPPVIVKLQKLQYISAGSAVTADEVRESNGSTHPAVDDCDGHTVVAGDDEAQTASTALAMPTDGVDGSRVVAAAVVAGDDEVRTTSTALATRIGRRKSSSSRAHDFVVCCSGLLPKKLRQRQQFDNGGGGVEVPAAGIGNLTAMHTLGVVNVSVVGGNTFLKELTKLTQLRKLRVSSVNRKIWKDLCVAISCQVHLETLSVRFDYEEQHPCCLDDISKPPKKLVSLKLYRGNIHVSPTWMKNIQCLRKAHLEDLELTVSTQEDIENLMQLQLMCRPMYRRLCVKPSQDGELHCGWNGPTYLVDHFRGRKILKIDCGSYKSKIVFKNWMMDYVEVIVVHCSTTESSLEVSGLTKFEQLKEIRLKGSYSDALKQHFVQKIAEIAEYASLRIVALKLEERQTHQSPPTPPSVCWNM